MRVLCLRAPAIRCLASGPTDVSCREWFPLPGASKAAARDLPDPPDEVPPQPSAGQAEQPLARNWGPGYSIRPKLPREVWHGLVHAEELACAHARLYMHSYRHVCACAYPP